MSKWTVFSNHGHVLLFLSNDPEARLRDVASSVGITERAVQKIVRDLQDGGMVSVSKHGRRNRYQIIHTQALRHQLEAHCSIGQLIELIESSRPDQAYVNADLPIETSTESVAPRAKALTPQQETRSSDPAGKSAEATDRSKGGTTKNKPAKPASKKAKRAGSSKPRSDQGSLF